MKLGEVLVHRRLIGERQLAEALKAQLIFGGLLGTCGSALLDEAARGAERCILFRVQDGTAHYWDSRGLDTAPAIRAFAVASEPLARLVAEDPHYKGPLPDDPGCGAFYDRLGIKPAAEVVLIPIRHGERLVALYYADSGCSMGLDDACLDAHLRLARLLGLGLGMIEIEVRVRAVCR